MHMQQTSVPGQAEPNDRALARGGLARWGLASGRPAIESVKKTGALIVGTWFADSALCCSVSPAVQQRVSPAVGQLGRRSAGRRPAKAEKLLQECTEARKKLKIFLVSTNITGEQQSNIASEQGVLFKR